jgi:predicted nuclease of predicted toxin-antitoxin system
LSAKSDPEIFRYAYANDMVVLTINVGDFLTLAKGVELHPGILALRVSGLSSDEQWRCVKPAIEAWLASEDPASDLVNSVVEIFEDGKFRRYTLPPP